MGQTLSRKDRILKGDKVTFPTASEQILMKHVKDGGSGGGLQLEQIGTTHNVGWFSSGGGGQITYYKINDFLCAVTFNFGGSPTELTKDQKITLDANPNVTFYTKSSPYTQTPSSTMIAVTDRGEYRHLICTIESGKLHVINPNDNFNITAMYNTILLIGAPVENPT